MAGGVACSVATRCGVCTLVAQRPERNTIQFAEDGLNFHVIGSVREAPIAAGIFRPDFSDGVGVGEGESARPTWGISHVVVRTPWHHLRRFEFSSDLAK